MKQAASQFRIAARLGGNIVNASPAADSPPALLAYDAEIELISTRRFSLAAVPAAFTPATSRCSLVQTSCWREFACRATTRGATHYYRKVGTRKAQAISKVCLAAVAKLEEDQISDMRIALGSVAPIVVRCVQTENALRGRKLDDRNNQIRLREVVARKSLPLTTFDRQPTIVCR